MNCVFNNPECPVTCACGDVECHRYCLGWEEKENYESDLEDTQEQRD